MGIVIFIIALVLAIPTYGLSVLAWLAYAYFGAKSKVNGIERREGVKNVLEPLFNGRFSEFFEALDIPVLHGLVISHKEAYQGGRHIMNYIAHNPVEAALFMRGLERWRTKGTNELCDPVTVAEYESAIDTKGDIHLVAYRAIEAIAVNNKEICCFDKVDIGEIMQHRTIMEFRV